MTELYWYLLGAVTPLLVLYGFLWEFKDGRKGWEKLLSRPAPKPRVTTRKPLGDRPVAMTRENGGGPGRGFTRPPAGGPARTRGGSRMKKKSA